MHSWLYESPVWDKDKIKLIQNVCPPAKPLNSNIEEIIHKSDAFPLQFPTDNIRCKTLSTIIDENILNRNINSTYPLIHESVLHLCTKFLEFKLQHGTDIEKNLYKDMNLKSFIERLISKKAAAFVDPAYEYYLSDGTKGSGDWQIIGTNEESPPLVLENCLSYHELKLSCFISISSYSYFINNGARSTKDKIESRDDIENEGVVISLIGPKLTMENLYDHRDIISSIKYPMLCDSVIEKLFYDFYGEKLTSYNKYIKLLKKPYKKFIEFRPKEYFNNDVYKKRLIISFDTFLFEANNRAKECNKTAYVHFIGIGLGIWCVSGHQESMFVEALAERLKLLGTRISHISDIHLSYFNSTEHCGNIKNGEIFQITGHPTGIKIHISKREPFSKLPDSDKLLVVSYAADANSLPGNEFWKGFLGNSSDSATASSSQISELHNPHINPLVCADNLRVVTVRGTLETFPEYVQKIKERGY